MPDVIVIGLGSHGSAAALALARRGAHVVGLEVAGASAIRGSGGGSTRIIRLAYVEHPDYVPLLRKAWSGWRDLEERTATTLLIETGGVYIGARDSATIRGAVASALVHDLEHELLDADEIRVRWPVFAVEDSAVGLYERQAGFVRSESAIVAQRQLAKAFGADLRFGEEAESWRETSEFVEVSTRRQAYRADRLVIAAGAWTGTLLPELASLLTVERVALFWVEPTGGTEALRPGRFPIWIMEAGPNREYYGFPYIASEGLKVARHHFGTVVDPKTVELEGGAARRNIADIAAFLSRSMPGAVGPMRSSQLCLYTNTPDEHFLIGSWRGSQRTIFASACSGHGFKFAPVIGDALADLALDGQTNLPIAFLSPDRFVSAGISA